LQGVKKIDDYTFTITIKGLYPQFNYWLAMPFFAPIPWEAERFYAEPDMDDRNLGLGWYPVGTGPFMLSENNPNSQMVLDKNPHFHGEPFPASSTKEDKDSGFLHHPKQSLPLINKAIYTLEKEAIPRWSKFLQGYYDLSGVSADSFDQAIHITPDGEAMLTPEMKEKGLRLTQMTDPSIFYMGFNMLDKVVGGKSDRARKLRQAIAIAVNYDENIAIFFNGRGLPAQGPIPPGIFGYLEGKVGVNPYVYQWQDNKRVRRSIKDAKRLMKQAGYPNGRDPKTGHALILNYDVPATGGPDDKAQLNWMRKQFARIGISLNIRATQYNRFQEKMRSGNAQIFTWGWNADYPDPENFLFLLYGPNGKVKHGGENAANFNNPEYDRLFDLMKNRPNDDERQQIINKMVNIARHDSPWVFGINTQSLSLSQQWVAPFKPNTISQSTLKYMAIDVPLRNQLRTKWNSPLIWPIALFVVALGLLLLPFLFAYFRRLKQQAPRSML
jgi:oligopeptide transport system substrate-binding protein